MATLPPLKKPHIPNPERDLELQAQEKGCLHQLRRDPSLLERLRPVTGADLRPGLILYYKLSPGYGCHILRGTQDGYNYRPETDIRGAVEAGNIFFTIDPLSDD